MYFYLIKYYFLILYVKLKLISYQFILLVVPIFNKKQNILILMKCVSKTKTLLKIL